MAADPDQDFIDFVNHQGSPSPGGSPGSPTGTMTPDPDQDFIDMVNKSRSPTPTATSAPSRSPYTDQAVQQQSETLSPRKPGIPAAIGGAAVRGFLPGRAMLAAYPLGSVLGAAGVGAVRGALVGAAVPIAGETGLSEAVGGVIGGLIAGGIAAWGAYKLQTAAADVISPGGAFSSKTEKEQVEAHPYASIVGGGLSFGKPNPMNLVRAAKTLSSQEGRQALVAFTRTKGKGMAPQAVDEVGNVINVAMAGGLNSVFNIKEQIESGHYDPAALATAAATGLIFNEPWFHKPNSQAAAAAKVMAKSGVPTVGPPDSTAPPGIAAPEPPAAPGVVPPPMPRVPGLLDFEVAGPRTETARAPEQPLPEAPIPGPGTEGGITNAPETRQVTESSVTERAGVPPGQDVSAHPEEVRTVGSEQAGNRGGAGAAAEEPVTFEDKLAQFKQRLQETKIAPREYKALRDSIMNEGKGGDFMGLTEDQRMSVLEVMNDVTLEKIQSKPDPRQQRLEQIDREISDYYDREELPPKALHNERKAIEDQMQREHEASLLEEAQGHQARGGDELLDAVAEHGVPINDPAFPGELKNLQEHFAPKNKYGQEKHRPLASGSGEKLYWGDVFKANAGSMDSLTQFLKRKGFDVETPDDTIKLLDERLRSGKKVYGDEARAQALEEQSFQDYQGPMRMAPGKPEVAWQKHAAGGLFATIPKELGGGSARIEPSAFGSDKVRLRLHDNPLTPEFYKHQFYDNVAEAKHALIEGLRGSLGEQEKWSPQKSWLPGRNKSPDQLDKDIAIAAKKEEDLSLPKSEPGTDIVGTSQDAEQLDRLVGEAAYKESIVNVVIKELLQNGFDAVREQGASKSKPGRIYIDYDYSTRTITVRDDGVGMSPETIVTAFLRTGGTKKSGDHQNTSGGLGVAKLAFIKGSKRIKLVTVQNGLKSVMDVDQAQIKANHIPLVKTYTNEPNGTTVTVEIPRTYVNTKAETIPIHFDTDPEFLKNPLFGPVEVTVNGKANHMGIHTTGWVKDNVFNFRWGHADVYVDPRPLEKYKWVTGTVPPVYRVMSAGLHQFEVPWNHIFENSEQRIPHNMVIDVRPHVDTKDPQYPFDNQREGWRGSVKSDAAALYSYLKRQGLEQELKKSQEAFAELQVMTHVPLEDMGKSFTPDQLYQGDATKGAKGKVTLPKITSIDVKPDKVVTNYSTGKTDVQSHEQFNKPTFSAEREIDFEKTKLDTSHLKPENPLYHNNTNFDFEQIKGAPELHAKLGSMLIQYMREFGAKFGLDPTARPEYAQLTNTAPGEAWLGGISYDKTYAGYNITNPFRSLWANPAGISEGGMSSTRRAAAEMLHIFLHEITHVPERNEGSGFTREELNNIGRMVDFPQQQKFLQAMEQVLSQHWDTLHEIRNKYYDAGTENRAEGFKNASALGPESKGAQGADERVPGEHAPEAVSNKDPGQTGAGRAGETNPKSGQLGTLIEAAKSGAQSGAEPAHPEVAAAPPEPQRVPAAAPVPEGGSGRSSLKWKAVNKGVHETERWIIDKDEQGRWNVYDKSVHTGSMGEWHNDFRTLQEAKDYVESQHRDIPSGLIEEGLHTEYPEIGAHVDRYIHDNDVRGIFAALKDPRYDEYKTDLHRLLRRQFGDSIPVARVPGYASGGTGKSGGLAYVSVSTNPEWGAASAKKGMPVWKGTVKPEDVILAGHEAEGELIVKKSGIKTGERGGIDFHEGPQGDIRASTGGNNPLYFKFEPVHQQPGAYRIDFSNVGVNREPASAFPIFRKHLPEVVSEFVKQYNPKELYALAATDARYRLYGKLIENAGLKAEPITALHQKGYKISIPGKDVRGIRDTLSGIREAAAQPPETPEQRKFAPLEVQTGEHEPRPPTPNEAAGPGLRDLNDHQMSQVISNSLQKFHEPGITESVDASGGMSHNDFIDAGREAIRHGVDPEAVAASRAIPSEQKYTVVKAHAEDLREIAEQAEQLAKTHPTQANKDAADAAFSDYSNWDKETVKSARDAVDAEHPGMPPEEYNPRSMTDLRQQMIRQNNRDFTEPEKRIAEQRLKEVEKAVAARNKELMKRDAELAKESPDLVRDIKNGDDLFEYTAEVMKKLFPCK